MLKYTDEMSRNSQYNIKTRRVDTDLCSREKLQKSLLNARIRNAQNSLHSPHTYTKTLPAVIKFKAFTPGVTPRNSRNPASQLFQ